MNLAHHPLSRPDLSQVNQCSGPPFTTSLLLQSPASQVVGAGDNAGSDCLGDPDLVDEIANRGLHLYQVAGFHAEPVGIMGVQPHWILVRNFVQPLGVAGAAVYECWQPEGWQQQHFILAEINIVRMNMALDIGGSRILWPFPVLQCFGIELKFARRRGKADVALALDFDSNRGSVFGYDSSDGINRAVLEIFRFQRVGMQTIGIFFYQERAVFAHIVEGCESLCLGCLRKTRHAVFKDPAVIFVNFELLAGTIWRFKVSSDSQR